MFLNKKSPAVNGRLQAPPSPSQQHGASLVREAWWLGLVLVGLYLAVILISYHNQDPSWSHMASDNAVIQNAGGAVGAWIADMLLYLFGFSAWWWVILAFYSMWLIYLRLELTISERPFLVFNLVGFALLLISSCALEAGHLITLPATLSSTAGGMLGNSVDGALRAMFGFTGSTMLLLLLFAVGFSLFTGWSWIMMTEKLGKNLIDAYEWSINKYHDWQDRKAGKAVVQKREEFVEAERKRTEDRAPVEIKAPVIEIAQSERVQKEKQTTLFTTDLDSSLPPLHLLDEASNTVELPSAETLDFTSRLIERKLMDFGIEVKVLSAQPGPVITRYELEPAAGVKGSQVTNLVKDLARALSVASVRVVETIPGKTYMGLEIPNPKRQIVYLSEIMSSQAYASVNSPLAICLGKDIAGKPAVADLAKMPHVLVAGTTGSGKSVAINALILSWLYKADASQVRMILIDPKMLELSVYEGIPHLLAPVVTDMRQAANALNWCVNEMERRYKLMSSLGVRNLAGYNQKIKDADKAGEKIPHPFSITPDAPEPLEEMPLIVVVIDE
ncbi:MAG: cell division protein FtsK, partial [Methylotenera sp.]